MSKPPPARYRTSTWSDYNASLRKRGSLLIWVDKGMTWRAPRDGRAFWKRWTGHHVRSRIEAMMRCLKAFGERVAARDPDRQTAEIHIRIAPMNLFNSLGTAEIIRVA